MTVLTWQLTLCQVDVLRGALEVIMKNTLPVENEASKEGCKKQREDWV